MVVLPAIHHAQVREEEPRQLKYSRAPSIINHILFIDRNDRNGRSERSKRTGPSVALGRSARKLLAASSRRYTAIPRAVSPSIEKPYLIYPSFSEQSKRAGPTVELLRDSFWRLERYRRLRACNGAGTSNDTQLEKLRRFLSFSSSLSLEVPAREISPFTSM